MRMRTLSTGRNASCRPIAIGCSGRGFTLVEVTVVVIIVAVLAGMVVPRMVGSVSSSELREAARGLLMAATYAREYAVTRRCCCRLSILPDQRRYVLEYQPDPERRPGEYEVLQGGLVKFAALPERVRLERVKIQRADRRRGPEKCIIFQPTGESDAAVVGITDGRRTYSLLVFPSTGRARLVEGRVEQMPSDREDLDA